jgi:signal transduction histidine kinase
MKGKVFKGAKQVVNHRRNRDAKFFKDYYAEIILLNYSRLHYIAYFLFVSGIFLLYSDLQQHPVRPILPEKWFLVLHFGLLLLSILLFLLSKTYAPKTPPEIKLRHKVFFHISLCAFILCCTEISIIEVQMPLYFPTYLIGIFLATGIFLHYRTYFLLYLIISQLILYTALFQSGITVPEIIRHYHPVFVLVVLAWWISRMLVRSHHKTFLSRKEVEEEKNRLDKSYRKRTEELEISNKRLLQEIKEREWYKKCLIREKKKADEANHLKSIFLANISHEIRTPLNGVIGFSELLQNPNLSKLKRERYQKFLNANGEQLLKIFDDVMDISMIESHQLKLNLTDFHIKNLLPEAKVFSDSYAASLDKHKVQIINEGINHPESLCLNSDPTRIQQVLYHLLSNAIKFTEKGFVRFGIQTSENTAMIFVEDSGIGVSAHIEKSMFERFRQGEESFTRSFGGNGLGLSISKGLIEMLGGLIWHDNTYKQGARFCFTLPYPNLPDALQNMQLIANFRKIAQHVLVISSNDEESRLLSLFSTQKKYRIQRIQPEGLARINPVHLPKIIVMLLHDDDEIWNQDFGLMVKKFYSHTTFAVIDKDSPKKLVAENAGCTYIFERPLNLHQVLLSIQQVILEQQVGETPW